MGKEIEKAVMARVSGIQRQIARLEKVSTQFGELPGKMRQDLSTILVARHQPACPPSEGNFEGCELEHVLDVIADRLESALDGCIHTLNEVDL